MSIPLEHALALAAEFQSPQVANLFAQAQAKHVLYEVGEVPENFPAFDPDLDDKVTFLVYALLAVGCSMIEQGDRLGGVVHLERAASLLVYVHGPHSIASRESSFHTLVAAMAFYAAGHYSRAFVTIRAAEGKTSAARIIAAFLRKDVSAIITQLNEALLTAHPAIDDQEDLSEWAITVSLARAVALALEFIFTGSSVFLVNADKQLHDTARVASIGYHSAWWWIVRLLRLMLNDLGNASPWSVLPPFFPSDHISTLGRYIRLLAFAKHPIAELWISQRTALPLALNQTNPGAVINLRTSAGKTRVAELAILQTLLIHPHSRILYLAPFRSLALEIEHTLGAHFSWLGYTVSHLYGGARVSTVDTELASESNIVIATPEKTRALFRAVPELFDNVKLIIIDEGHLVGSEDRFVRNEVFIEHLCARARTTGARVLLLSAVLPNAAELAEWVTGDPDAVASSRWKPSTERFGLLRWNGSRVRIDWQGEVLSFNPSFVEVKPLGFGKRRKPFPSTKNEAIAATAVRLSTIGPVMIFTGKAISVPTLAESVLLALGEAPHEYPWPAYEWKVFEAVCREELEPNAVEARAARVGVVCHSNRLPPQVRLALEHLMRSKPPKILIATTTLAQGVNVGISSVIVATPYIDKQMTINKNDFWNICGRAGRAFVDGEGKILYTIDETKKSWQKKKDERLAQAYFDASTSDRVESGLFSVVSELRRIAGEAGIAFAVLLELAANNDFSCLEAKATTCEEKCALLDDALLALQIDPIINPTDEEPAMWVERVFRRSLAAIQARANLSDTGTEDVLAFLRARAESVIGRVMSPLRKAIVSSGLPLSIALRTQENLDFFRQVADGYNAAQGELSALIAAVREIEEWVRATARVFVPSMPTVTKLDTIRDGWLGGIALWQLVAADRDAKDITRELYGLQLPWMVHAAAQQLRAYEDTERADLLATIALTIEVGIPTELAARIFLAGVRSRVAATELAALGVPLGTSVPGIRHTLRDPEAMQRLLPLVSPATAGWLELLGEEAANRRFTALPKFGEFTLSGVDHVLSLHARRLENQIFLCSVDGRTRIPVQPTSDLPFDQIANDPRVVFVRSEDVWSLVEQDPRLERRWW